MTGAKDSNLSTPNSETELEKRDLEQKQVEQRDEESGTLESDDNDADSTMIQEKVGSFPAQRIVDSSDVLRRSLAGRQSLRCY